MSNISSINSRQNQQQYQNNRLSAKMASGKKQPKAADGAAELAIVTKELMQARGLDTGTTNASHGTNLLNIADGALAGVTDYLQGIRDLSIQAQSDAIYTSEDVAHMQAQADQYMQGISDIASQTQYNTMNILDGSRENMNIAADSNGSYTTVSPGNATLEALGLSGKINISDPATIDTIDRAIERVNTSRGNIGAKTNALEYLQNNNNTSSYNHTSSASKMGDLDYGKATTANKRQQVLLQYTNAMQKRHMDDEAKRNRSLF
jgi:flagellin